jgi:hypothetical protein
MAGTGTFSHFTFQQDFSSSTCLVVGQHTARQQAPRHAVWPTASPLQSTSDAQTSACGAASDCVPAALSDTQTKSANDERLSRLIMF